MNDRGFWSRHAIWPLLVLTTVFLVVVFGEFDRPIATALYYDVAHGWIGAAGRGEILAHDITHDAGRWVIRVVAASMLVCWLLSFRVDRLKPWRREALYAFVAMVLAISVVGILKTVTNVDCPWSLAGFGGRFPYVTLFGNRPDQLPQAQCFPGSHAASGFALFAFYFALRDRLPRRARAAFIIAVAVGLLFSIAQEARGAHFFSHDLASATLVWFIQLGLYALMLKARARTAPAPIS